MNLCSFGCINNKNVTRNYCKSYNKKIKLLFCICDHQARDLLACVDIAMILSNCKIIAQDTPSNLVKDINAKNAYFGNSFKFN